MIKALLADGSEALSWEVDRGGEFFCPECREALVYKCGPLVMAHFAHRPGSSCCYGVGESLRHQEMKRQMGTLFSRMRPRYEVSLIPGRRADLVLNDTIVVECQESPIGVEEWEWRTADYSRHGCNVLWIWDLPLILGQLAKGRLLAQTERLRTDPNGFSREFRIPAYVRHCHQHSWGKVYTIDSAGELWSCHFGRAATRLGDSGPTWDAHDYTPRTLKYPSFRPVTPRISFKYGTDNERLVDLGEGVWWKTVRK